MMRPRQPGPRAFYVYPDTRHAADQALEPADQPGYVRVYVRQHGASGWQLTRTITVADAARQYGYPATPDSSD